MKILVQFSGGKDSQACLIKAVNDYGKDKVTAVFCDTGWEHKDTYTHINSVVQQLGVPLITLHSKKYNDFVDMSIKKGRFPSSQRRFCTSELKVIPMIDYILSQDENFIIIQGIRANYPLWEKRIQEIQEGHAVLSVRQWSGKPYRSKQVEIARLTADNGIGIQKLSFDKDRDGVPSLKYFNINRKYIDMEILANNDGLSKEYWQGWFRGYDLSMPMAIIHFTPFRY